MAGTETQNNNLDLPPDKKDLGKDQVKEWSPDLIEPCHEFKAFTNTTEETKMEKYGKGLQNNNLDLPADKKDLGKDQVRERAPNINGVDQTSAEIFSNQDVTGESLKTVNTTDFNQIGVKFGPARGQEIIENRRHCTPSPFGKYAEPDFYIEGDILQVAESGASDLIEPCHEFKAFTNTTEETKMEKYQVESCRFGAACINSRTNGTIHFGVADEPHGKILGVPVNGKEKELYCQERISGISGIAKYFDRKQQDKAKQCIKPPRFVEVLNHDLTPTGKFVIEVDIVPHHVICKSELFHTFISYVDSASKKKRFEKQFYVRDGGSSTNLLAPATSDKGCKRYKDFGKNLEDLAELRKQAEERHQGVSHMQGSKLSQMITGGTGSLDRSYYKKVIIVTNKSHPVQLESLSFLLHLRPAIVFDFGQQSAESTLYQYLKHIDELNESTRPAKGTSLTFCSPFGSAQKGTFRQAFNTINWKHDMTSVQAQVEHLCQKKKFLVIFLVLSKVADKMDPLVETFCTFYKRLKCTKQILSICANESIFTSWKSLINALCEVDISNRCIHELSLAEVNGTVLSLLSEKRRSSRFLPGAGGSRVLLEEWVESQVNTLDVLCVNQCEGGNEQNSKIQAFWGNTIFSKNSGSIPIFHRDKFEYAVDILIPNLCSLKAACVLFNLLHEPGSGGTTLAKHILRALRGKFRCAELRNNSADLNTVAGHVVTLLKCGCTEQKPPVPVLLMIDDFENMEKVFSLQQLIKNQCLENNNLPTSPQVILLNCMKSEFTCGPFDPTEDTIFIRLEHENGQFVHPLEQIKLQLAKFKKICKKVHQQF